VTGEPFDPIEEAARQWLEHWGPDALPSMSAVTSIMRVQQILLGRLNALLRPYDLTFPRYEALMILYYSRHGSLPLGKLGGLLQVHPTSVTNLIDRLESSGFVRRESHHHDRRTTLAAITPEGRRVAKAATQLLNEARFATDPLDDTELEAISDTLQPLRAAEDGFDDLVRT
jgi:DNA-binding MarR family transcriptional regulator